MSYVGRDIYHSLADVSAKRAKPQKQCVECHVLISGLSKRCRPCQDERREDQIRQMKKARRGSNPAGL